MGVRTREVKRDIVDALVARLREERATMDRAARAAHEAATHEESKPENDKDTRGLEASYLAGAQAARVRELELAVKMLEGLDVRPLAEGDMIRASSVVAVEDEDGRRTLYFVSPHGGGIELSLDGEPLLVVTPQSPLGRALLGKRQGDTIEAPRGGARGARAGERRELCVVDVW